MGKMRMKRVRAKKRDLRWDLAASDKLNHQTIEWMKHHSISDLMDIVYEMYNHGYDVDGLMGLFRELIDIENDIGHGVPKELLSANIHPERAQIA
jgi:hypothetical protein